MSYLTEGDLENFILEDIDASFSTWIASVITMVEDYIKQYCEVDFESSGSATRYFDGSGSDELYVGDIQSISELKLLDIYGNTEATIDIADSYLYPLNETVKSILKLSQGASYRAFPERTKSVKITGVWGYTTVPTPIKLAAIKLAAKIVNEGLRGGKATQETLGSYSISYEKVDETADVLGIRDILNQYRKINLGGI